MPPPLHRLIKLATTGAVVGGIVGGSGHATIDAGRALAQRGPVPVLAPWSSPSVERDMPPVVQKRNSRAQRALYDQARAAARLPATKANGCVPAGSGRPLGPPSPRVTPRLLGHHVEVVFEFARLPRSPACRPFGLTVAVLSGRKSSSTFRNWVERYRIRGARGRVALNLPSTATRPIT